MSTALALRGPHALVPSAPIGPGTALQTPAGAVSAFFVFESYDRRRGVAIYGLRVVNQTASALICRTWVVTNAGDAVAAYPLHFEIKPSSTTTTQVPMWPRDFESFSQAIAEVIGDDVHCVVQAPAPVMPKRRAAYATVAAACVILILLGIVGAAAVAAALPRIAAFAVPPMALSGTTVQAEYGASGIGALAYEVMAPDGRRVQGGALTERSGSIPVALSPAANTGAYTLQMTLRGPFGSAKEVRVLNAVQPKRSGAQIADIAVNPVVAKPGQAIDVTYAASADNGYLRLTGSDGTIWAQKPFSRTGSTSFVVPPTGNAKEMRVVLHVTKGRSAAESSAGLLVAASPAHASAAAAEQVAGDDNPSPVTDSEANGTFALLTPSVRSAAGIRVAVLSPRNDMRIVLDDSRSREVAGLTVGADATTVTLKAPTVTTPTRYTVVANFTDGFGQESIVEPITVRP